MAVELDMLNRPVVSASSHIQRTKEKRGTEGEEKTEREESLLSKPKLK